MFCITVTLLYNAADLKTCLAMATTKFLTTTTLQNVILKYDNMQFRFARVQATLHNTDRHIKLDKQCQL